MTDEPDPAAIEALLLALVRARRADASICPSEVARGLDDTHWRSLMPPVRDVARRLAQQGVIEVTQRGRVLDADEAWRGAIRLRARREPP